MTTRGIDWNLEGYGQKARFSLGGAFELFDFIHLFLRKAKCCPWMLKDNVEIESVFGSPTCIWNGGRTLTNTYYNKQQLQNIRDTYADLGVRVRFTFTSPLLDEHDLHDRYCNLVMAIFQDVSPEVVVNSPLLEDYLRDQYPMVSFVSSTTKRLRSKAAQLKELGRDYRYVCIDYDYNFDSDFLGSIPEAERDRIEILINSTCPKGCDARVLHQEYSARRQLEFGDGGDCDNSEPFLRKCPLLKRRRETPLSEQGYTKDFLGATNYILPQELDRYLDMGYSHFKIQGRELTVSQMFAEFLPYLVKPEFYPTAISMLV